MAGKVFFIADMHFGHEAMLRFEKGSGESVDQKLE